MWVYIKSETNLYTVGFYDPQGGWHSDSDYNTKHEAAARVAYLNGGKRQERIIVEVTGGVVSSVRGVPAGVVVEVRDYDEGTGTWEDDPSLLDQVRKDKHGDRYAWYEVHHDDMQA